MAYALRPGSDLIAEAKRIAREQLRKASDELASAKQNPKAVHNARKALKRGRGVLHLVKPALRTGSFQKHDQRLRDLGRLLAGPRDCQAMLAILDGLQARFGRGWAPRVTGSLRATFQGKLQREELLLERSIEAAAARLRKARRKIGRLEPKSGKASLGPGIERTYSRAQRRYRRACELGSGAAFHEWRKEAQRHWRQMQLVAAAWPEAMTVRIEKAQALSQCLGDDHDLHILLGHVRDLGPDIAEWSELEAFYDGCVEWQLALRMASRNHGALLFAERPDAFRKRLMRYWQAASARYSQGATLPGVFAGDGTVVAFPGPLEGEVEGETPAADRGDPQDIPSVQNKFGPEVIR